MSPPSHNEQNNTTMRAKRYIYIVIGIALCLQACRRESHPSNPDVEELAISMAASSVESTTRALINSAAELQSFRVDAYKEGTANEQVFSKHEITRSGTKWEYTPVRYWDTKGYYYFGAYSPENTAISTETKGVLTISAPNWQAIDGTEKDIIVATSQGAATDYLNTHGGTVKLGFTHILAQLEVKIVRNSMLVNTYRLTGLDYIQVPVGDGTTVYTLNYTTPTSSAMATPTMGSKVVYSGTAVEVYPEANTQTTFTHLLVPFSTQAESELQVEVSYSINNVDATPIAVNTGLKTLEAGKRYVLTLTFDSGARIKPDLKVLDWDTKEVDEDDKYNW